MIDEKLATWALARIDGIGPASFQKLIELFGTAAGVFDAHWDSLAKADGINRSVAQKIKAICDWDKIQAGLEKSIPSDSQVVALAELDYPSKLKNISDPPPLLYYRGDLSIFERPTLAVVGSRRPSDYGLRITSRLVTELARADVVIVSGLAYGIDGAAHQAVLEAGGTTAAVFGCGLDTIYPSGHKALAQRITQSGCLISEFPKGTPPERFNFPVRNRIVSGLSDGVLVVEAGQKSGALVTAQIALEQGRDIFAIPGSLDNELSYGPNSLIKQGAATVTTVDDIFNNFGWHKSEIAAQPAFDLGKLSKDERLLYEQLSPQPLHLDELGRKLSLGTGKIAEVLLNLELKGLILRKPGNFVVKA